MILELTLEKDINTNKILSQAADYHPTQAVKDRTAEVLTDFMYGYLIRNKPYREFNDLSLVDRMNLDHMSFNQYIEPSATDPASSWRSTAFRPIVRNKAIAIAANITAQIVYPKIYAENDNSEEDKASAQVMRDLMQWTFERSKYEERFLDAVINTMYSPATFIYTGYCEYFRDIKVIQEDGTWKKMTIPDEEFSGFQDRVVPCDEIYIANIYEPDIQKQPFIIWRRVIDFATAKEKYKESDTFKKYVKAGLQFLYNDQNDLWYQVYDQSLRQNLVEEVVYFNRGADLEISFVNGILMDDVDQPMKREDKKYPFIKTGYEKISDRFFYYKSLAFKLAPDEQVLNVAYRMLADGTYLQTFPPAVVFGDEEIGSAVIAPGVVTTVSNKDNPNASFQTINTNNNLTATFNLIEKVESSITESSINELQPKTPTAFQADLVQQNANVLLGLFTKMIGFMVRDLGVLRVNDILQFMTVAQVNEIGDESDNMKFRTFLLPDQQVDGVMKTKKIQFDGDMPDTMSDDEQMKLSTAIYREEHELDDNVKISKVNPALFRELKFHCVVRPEAVLPKSDAFKKAMMLEEYDRALDNPLTNKTAITRDLLLGAYDKTSEEPDKYMMDEQQMMQAQQPQDGQTPPGSLLPQPGAPASKMPNINSLIHK